MNKVYISKEQAELIHGEEVALAHHGVKGMKWGVRKDSGSSGGIRGAIKNQLQIDRANKKAMMDNWKKQTEGMSFAKKAGLYFFLGPKYGANVAAKMKARKEDPKRIVKKETRKLRAAISHDFGFRSTAEFNAHEKQFKQKYGPTHGIKNLFTKEGRAKNRKLNKAYSDMLTKRMETMLKEVAEKHLSGTNYKLENVQGYNDFIPDFQVTPTGGSIEHAATSSKPKIVKKSYKLEFVKDSSGNITGLKFPDDFLDLTDEELAFLDED